MALISCIISVINLIWTLISIIAKILLILVLPLSFLVAKFFLIEWLRIKKCENEEKKKNTFYQDEFSSKLFVIDGALNALNRLSLLTGLGCKF